MAKRQIKHRPELTKEGLLNLFKEHFSGKYEVLSTVALDRDFIVKQSGFSGVFVKLIQKTDRTVIVYNRNAPNPLLRSILSVMFGGQKVFSDVEEFLSISKEFS